MSVVGKLQALQAYLSTRWRASAFKSWEQVDAYRTRKLAAFMANDLPAVPAFQTIGCKASKVSDLPFMDKSKLMANFSGYNRVGIDPQTAWSAFHGTKQFGELIVGASTGTSGNRGLFVISDTERFRWLGTILAKALPGFWKRRYRVAVILPLNTPLYDSANVSRLLRLKFFDVTEGPELWVEDLQSFDPHIVISSPKILLWLVQNAPRLNPETCFSAAETLDPHDRSAIELRFGSPLGQIYMATEGLIAVSCTLGQLHLCDDTMYIELDPAGDGLVTPVITDFSRQTQVMVRYRMNDLLRMASTPCRCGSPLRSVEEVVGRADDMFTFATKTAGNIVEITPDVLRNVVVDSDRQITDYRLRQTGTSEVELLLPVGAGEMAGRVAQSALKQLFERRGLEVCVNISFRDLPLETKHKLRRVENLTRKAGISHGK